MPKPGYADRYFLWAVGLLLVVGLICLMSASSAVAYTKFGDTYYFVKRQIVLGIIPGIIFFLIAAKVDYRVLLKFSPWFYGLSIILLALVFIPGIGVVINGSRNWLRFAGFNLQPSEFVKITVILFLSFLLTEKNYDWDNWQVSLLPLLALLAPAGLLIVFEDVGTMAIISVIVIALFYLGGMPGRYLWALIAVGVVAFAILVAVAPYRAGRLTTFLHPELDPKGIGYQINQAFLAVGSGGIWGLGFGHSRQKFQYLPEVNADSIFAVIAEEMGLIGSLTIIFLFIFIGWRIFRIGRKAPDTAGQLIAVGVGVWFLTQSFFNIGAMVGALPLTGVPLPLISSGGSAMLANLTALGLVAGISRHS